MNNVIDAATQFRPRRGERDRSGPLDALRGTRRIDHEDRPQLAKALGEVASRIDPDHPDRVAKGWFEKAWAGDRWAKRKRYILFPDENAVDPRGHGNFAAAGSEYAALIEQAAQSLHPGNKAAFEMERARFCRDLLRGTSFLPKLSPLPEGAGSARRLMSEFAQAITEKIEQDTDLLRLWSVLEETPFGIWSYRHDEPNADDAHPTRWAGDVYGRGPLGDVAKLAQEPSKIQYRQFDEAGYRFEVGDPRHCDWSIPIIRLGLRGRRTRGRLFVIPRNFVEELPIDLQQDDQLAPEEVVEEWLIAKGFATGKAFEKLPDIAYSEDLGYGWKAWVYDTLGYLELSVREKPDGRLGLWISSVWDETGYYYPCLPSLDTLAIEATSKPAWPAFIGMFLPHMHSYEFIEWPTDDKFNPGGRPPEGAASGIVEIEYEELSDPQGWLDDQDNLELQDLLFRNPEGIRFCPSLATSDDIPSPFQPGTIAAAIFANSGCELLDRIGHRLLEQARTITKAGLGFHSALLSQHKSRLDKLFE